MNNPLDDPFTGLPSMEQYSKANLKKIHHFDVEMIDRLICYWRKCVNGAENEEKLLIARCYVDAYQTVRVNHGFGLLPPDTDA